METSDILLGEGNGGSSLIPDGLPVGNGPVHPRGSSLSGNGLEKEGAWWAASLGPHTLYTIVHTQKKRLLTVAHDQFLTREIRMNKTSFQP